MECLLGMKCQDFSIVAADRTASHSIMVMKTDEDKIYKLSDNLVMAVTGEAGDTTQFSEYISKNIQLYKMRNGYELSPSAAANFTRRNLAEALRSRGAYHVNMLLAGYDKQTGPELYFMDYLASICPTSYSAHGYGGFFALAIMDRYHRPNLTREEAYALLTTCVKEIHNRLIVNLPSFKVQIVDRDGVHDLPDITAAAYKK